MGVFDDKKFDELDWVSQAIEPIDSKLNEYLSALPDELVFDYQQLASYASGSYPSLNITHVISRLLSYSPVRGSPSWREMNLLSQCFKFEISDDVVINFEESTLVGEIKLVKVQQTLEEDVLKSILGKEGIETFTYVSVPFDAGPRMNEIMEILGGCDAALRTKSTLKKRRFINNRLVELFKTNEWNIKDTELANKVGIWISLYVKSGDMAAFSNFCRLKVMTHKDQPIYSMEEIK